mgnify:CR=1 FL=1
MRAGKAGLGRGGKGGPTMASETGGMEGAGALESETPCPYFATRLSVAA